MSKRLLMICYHYPPIAGSSGYQRTVNFARNLQEQGWEPLVLTVHPRAYPQQQPLQEGQGPRVERAFALDASRHLAIKGRYPAVLAWPDRWISWWLGAVPFSAGKVRKFAPDVIWSTYPIATAHLIGATWAKKLGRPWVADFRDPMSEDNYPHPMQGRLVRRIERITLERCARVVVTTDGAAREIAARYPDLTTPSSFTTISNGYDESAFADAERAIAGVPRTRSRIEIVHSGILYPAERDPRALFQALKELNAEGLITPDSLHVRLRATAHDALYAPQIKALGIESYVSLEPAVPYIQALTEMLQADALLLLQGSICNNQVPAKAYEYIRARRPVLALTDPAGDTARLLSSCGFNRICPNDSVEEIKKQVVKLLDDVRHSRATLPSSDIIAKFDRRAGAQALARVLDEVREPRSHTQKP